MCKIKSALALLPSFKEETMSYTKETYEKEQTEMIVKSSPPPDPFDSVASGYFSSEIDASMDLFTLKNLYFSEPWIYIICNIIARKISARPLVINKNVIKDGEITQEPDEGHQLHERFLRPNDFEGYANFIYKAVSELTLMGNAIIWKLRFRQQMILLPTEVITIEIDPKGGISHYNINMGACEEYANIFQGTIRIFPEDIIHIRLPNLASMIWGLSPFIATRKSLLFDRYSTEYLLNFYLKQANPGPVLEIGEKANEKQALRFLKSVEINWTGRRNQRRTMILPQGVSAKNLQSTLAEQDLKEHILLKRHEILAALAMPPHEIGLQATGSIGSEETKHQLTNFWDSTIIPYEKLVADSFSLGFERELGKNKFFEFDNSDVAILQANENEKADVATKQLSFKTINEVRADLYDLPPIQDGDKIPSTQQPQGQFPFSFSNPNRGEQGTETKPDPDEEDDKESDRQGEKIPMPKLLEENFQWWSERKALEDKTVSQHEKEMLEVILEIFAEQGPIALKLFKDIYKDRIKADSNIPENDRLRAALDKAFSEFEKTYTESGVPIGSSSAELGYDLHLNVPFNLPNQDEIIAIGERNREERLATLAARQLENFQGINRTTTDQIMGKIQAGLNESKTLDQIAKDIGSYFTDSIPKRAMIISRTEVLSAVSFGQQATLEDAQQLIPGMKKMWITAGDERVRSFAKGDASDHTLLDGVTVEANEAFKTPAGARMMFPRDPRGPANEIINCFPKGIKISMADDSLKNIEDIKVGQKVKTHLGDRIVVETHRNSFRGNLIVFEFNGETIRVTPNHRIFVKGKGWIEAQLLKEGDKLLEVKEISCDEKPIRDIEHPYSELIGDPKMSTGS